MNIVFITETCGGGHWKASLEAIQRLKSTNKKIAVELIAFEPSPSVQELGLFDTTHICHRSNLRPPFHVWRQIYFDTASVISALKKITKNKNVIILCTTPFGAYAARMIGVPAVYWFHGWRSCYLVGDNNNWKEMTLFIWEKVAMRLSRIILVPAEESKIILRKVLGDKPQIRVVRNLIQKEFFQQVSSKEIDKFRNNYHISKTTRIVSYVGRIAPYKGIEELVDAYVQDTQDNNSVLVLAFPENYNNDSVCAVVKNKLQKCKQQNLLIRGLGINELRVLYAASTAVFLPSLYENSPLVMWECLASGGLFIGSSAGDMRKTLGAIDANLVIESVTSNNIFKKIQWAYSLSQKEQQVLRGRLNMVARQKTRQKDETNVLHSTVSVAANR